MKPAALEPSSAPDLRELLRRAASCASLPELLAALGEVLPALLTARDRVSLALLEPDGERMRVYRLLPVMDTLPEPLPRVRVEGTAVGEVAREGIVRVVADVRADRNIAFGHASHDRIRSTVSVPVLVGGRIVGALNAGSKTPGLCSDAMVPRLRDLAAVIGPALLGLERAGAAAPVVEDDSGLLGESEAFLRLLEPARRAARSGANVLLTGETGVGKTAVARAMHGWSARASGPFITVHIGALSTTLVEAELFGHERGAFTGALSRRLGRFERARGGTLFIDEVADTPMSAQTKLLRVIQDGAFERVGGDETLRTDARLIAATHRDLGDAVASGEFREDLYYRINVVPLRVPPLRERGADVDLLAKASLARMNAEQGREMQLSPLGWRRLRAYRWPGNIRELESALRRAAALEGSDLLELESLGEAVEPPVLVDEWPTLEEHQRRYIARVLEHTGGVIEGPRGAARLLGLRPSTLRSRMKRLSVDLASLRRGGW